MFAQDFARLNEAYRVRHGLPGPRRFSDADLASCVDVIAAAEREIHGVLISEIAARRPLIPFRVTVSAPGRAVEQISILSRSSCDAAVQAINLLFADADDCTSVFRLRVEAIRVEEVSSGATTSQEVA